MTKTAEEKQATKDVKNKRRRDERAKAKVEALMADVATLLPGDTFTLDEVNYVVLSIDSQSGHIHTNLLEGGETPGTHGSVDFGTMVDIIAIAKAEVEEETTGETPVQDNPAVTGGRFFK